MLLTVNYGTEAITFKGDFKMSRQWYGSIGNRIEENRQFCDEIKVGTGVTEYHWSDRTPYEVIAVKDQKHITIRPYDVKASGKETGMGHQEWTLISNEDNYTIDLVKRGKYWYTVSTITEEDLNNASDERKLVIAVNGFDANVIREKGKQTKYSRMNISFGKAEYYYDWSF